MKENKLHQFTGLYPVQKTLRFELKPVGKTLENIQSSGLLKTDEHRAASYGKVKKIIDSYHKDFIGKALDNFALNYDDCGKLDSLSEFYFWYMNSKADDRKKKMEKIQDNLRKQIAKQLRSCEEYKRIDKKELIKEDLIKFVGEDEDRKTLVEEFKYFTTYFRGFNENRQNMYSNEAKSTAIAYRLIHENLPKFIDNINIFDKVQAVPEFEEKIKKLYSDFEPYLNVKSIADMFKLDYYSMVLTQTQIDVYNAVIGGRAEEQGKPKIKGLNEYINSYNQRQEDRGKHLPKLKVLYKQILSDREAISWLPEVFKDSNDVLENVEKCYQELNERVFADDKLPKLLANIADYDLSKIYITNDLQLTDISKKLFGNWGVILNAVTEDIKYKNPQGKKEKSEKYEEKIQKLVKKADSYGIAYLNDCLCIVSDTKVENYYNALCKNEDGKTIFCRIVDAYNEAKDLLNTKYPSDKNLAQDKANVALIKELLDGIKELQHFIKPLLGNGDESDKDERFYGELVYVWEAIDQITPLYNKVRNYVTRKPYSIEKMKLNFENSQLLNGWDVNKESDNTSIILRKDGLYYLAIMNKKFNKSFESDKLPCHGDCYEKMDYKLLPGANKMLPKVFFSKSRIGEFAPSAELLEKYEKGTHKKGINFNIDDCHSLIDFFKASIQKHEDWKNFGFNFSDTSTYEDLSGFYHEVEEQGYKLSFRNVSVEYVNNLVNDGKLYLFQIYNKDFSPSSKGTPNMHTLYWKMLFDERNLADVVYKLNGQAEVFFRKSSLKVDRPTHPANQPVKNKNTNNPKKESKFSYDLIKDRRFTVDKFQFHVPITMNFKGSTSGNINTIVNEYIKVSDDIHFIGIDRGERHLLYLTVIDSKGNIKEQYSLNEIVNEYNGNTYTTNYHDLLEEREKARLKERQSWQTIESIKELKEGYLSQVVHKIAQLIVKYNAIVILEDLNMGFKQGRQKVESSVYQQFEKSLIDKLNYLVDKNLPADVDGGLLHAYQLTNQFESFKKMGKQNGFLFYIPAWNTSKMDPITGFVNLFDTRYENVVKSQLFFEKFDSIKYNADKDWFEFSFDYDKFTTKAEGTRTKWTICTFGERIETKRVSSQNNQFVSEEFDLTEKFKDFFKQYSIDYKGNLKESIANQTDKNFFERLLHLLHLTLQMRNSKTGTETDYLISPVADENGKFYDSRTCGDDLPQNADANGAYNIARKGLWVAQQIKENDGKKYPRLAMTNKEWLNFAQNKPYLH